MTDTNEHSYSDLGIWHDSEERAAWLLRNATNNAVVIGNRAITSIEVLTRIIYDREVDRIKANEPSLFERENVIPTKEIPIEQ